VTARLLLANALELWVGVGVATILRAPLGVSYLAGLALVGVVSAHLALVHVTVGWIGLAVLAVIATPFALRARPRLRIGNPLTWAGIAALVALLVRAWPTFAAKPLDDYDSWAIWGSKAKALTLLGWADPKFFAVSAADPIQRAYPLVVPSLEAVGARAMGGFDPRLIHLQFLLFGVAGIAALHALLRERVASWLLWPLLVALAAAPAFLGQLLTAYADVPLALFVAAGLLAGARWLEDGEPRTLALMTLFLATAALTKPEGILFAAAAYVGLALASRSVRMLAISAAVVLVVLAPWELWVLVHHVPAGTSISLTSPDLSHPGIAPLAFKALLGKLFSFDQWPLLAPLFLLAVLTAARSAAAVFAWAWALLSILFLTAVYVVSRVEWSNYFAFSGSRVVVSVIVGATALTPLLLGEGLRIRRR
jgi:hypothetical protein